MCDTGAGSTVEQGSRRLCGHFERDASGSIASGNGLRDKESGIWRWRRDAFSWNGVGRREELDAFGNQLVFDCGRFSCFAGFEKGRRKNDNSISAVFDGCMDIDHNRIEHKSAEGHRGKG